jgi:hypothetical protein
MSTYTDFNFNPTFAGILKMALAVGYNLLYALLELTDNSLSKNTSNLQIRLEKTDGKPAMLDRISIIDDGDGMTSQGLKEAFIIAATKAVRDERDIGSFCVGMKYATMNIGSNITIISKVSGGSIVGLHANVEQMRINNTFRPTDFCSSVDDEWSMKYLSPGIYEKFKSFDHGTIIHVSTLRAKAAIRYDTAIDEINKGLAVAYASLYNDCSMTLCDGDTMINTIRPIDLFYHTSPENLDEDAYETDLNIYRGPTGCEQIVEVNTKRRQYAKNKYTYGRPNAPLYIEWFHRETPTGQKKLTPRFLIKDDIPDPSNLIGSLTTRTIQVKQDQHARERSYFPEGTPLHRDRKRFWFNRDIRCVAAGNSMGKKIDDRASTCGERQRTLVKFQSSLDEIVGSKFNKQMDNKELPCRLLGDVIFDIHRKVTNVWTTAREDTTVPSQDERSDEDEDEETPPTTANPFQALYQNKSIEPVEVPQSVVIPTSPPQEVENIEEIHEPIIPETVNEERIEETVEKVKEVPQTTTRADAFLAMFGITLERHLEQVKWLSQYDNV